MREILIRKRNTGYKRVCADGEEVSFIHNLVIKEVGGREYLTDLPGMVN